MSRPDTIYFLEVLPEPMPIKLEILEEIPIEPETPEERELIPEKVIEVEIPELIPIELETPEERELREFRRFARWFEEFLQEHGITIKNGIYIRADSVFEIRRRGGPTPNLPFAVWFGNAGGYKDLRLRKVDIYSPDNALLYSFEPNKFLPFIREEVDLRIAQEEKLERLLEEVRLLLKEEMGEKERERFRRIKKEANAAARMIFMPPVEILRANIDLTPYLKEVGDKATITVRASFQHRLKEEIVPLTVEIPFNFELVRPLPSP